MASTYLSRTPSSAGNTSVWTASFWIKCSSFTNQDLFNAGTVGTNHGLIFLNGNQQLEAKHYAGSFNYQLVTNRRFRDCNAWYHIVIAYNDLESTSSDRIKFYINGVQETSFATATYPSLNFNSKYNETTLHTIGRGIESGTSSTYRYFDGSMSHFHWIDGTAYAASTFGETDSTTGIWKPKTAPSVTYGTNGFFLKFENSGAFGTDSSGNSNTFTVNGTMTQTIDTPSNVFATFSPLVPRTSTGSAIIPNFSNGNLSASFPSSPNRNAPSTLAVSKGKYYAEFKPTNALSQNGTFYIGINCLEDYTNGFLGDQMYAYTDDGRKKTLGTYASYGNSYANNDIIGIALDLDNNKLYFRKNAEAWGNSGDPTSGATGTGAISLASISSTTDGAYFISNACTAGGGAASAKSVFSYNFGSPPYAISSGNADGNGYGNFEYAVPSGYYSLNTKNLGEFG